MYYWAHCKNEFFFLFTRNYNTSFEAAYSPVASNKYKYMMVYNFSYSPHQNLSFNSSSTVDFLEKTNAETLYARATTGGRIEYKKNHWYYTLNSYLQFGQNQKGQHVLAYYFQPEVKLSLQKSTWRLGAEIISGSSSKLSIDNTSDFDVLYGVTWKFNGNMNVFTRFPADVGGKGLVNPYLFSSFPFQRSVKKFDFSNSSMPLSSTSIAFVLCVISISEMINEASKLSKLTAKIYCAIIGHSL